MNVQRSESSEPVQHLYKVFRRQYRELLPQPTGLSPRRTALHGLRAVLFDLYGTLFVSGTGEVGTLSHAAGRAAAVEAAQAVGLDAVKGLDGAADLLQKRIRAIHAEMNRLHGIEYPEVQIAEVWADVVAELARRGVLDAGAAAEVDFQRLAVEYEARVNPCWPMPGLLQCLAELRAQGLLLGIVSNAQFYTPLLFPALLDRPAELCGFDPGLQFYSYRHGFAKPGIPLFALAARALSERGIAPAEALYVGNDMLNDIAPAARLGFQTALFAGDARSLRLRAEDPRIAGITATLTVTDLAQLAECTKILLPFARRMD